MKRLCCVAVVLAALSQLIGAHMGKLNATLDAIENDVAVPLAARMGWGLDVLGNWVGDPADPNVPGFFRDDDPVGDGVPDSQYDRIDAVTLSNELDVVTSTDVPLGQTHIYDDGGNLIFDGRLYYQYDAFNRLAQINLAGDGVKTWLTANDFIGGELDPAWLPTQIGGEDWPVLARFYLRRPRPADPDPALRPSGQRRDRDLLLRRRTPHPGNLRHNAGGPQ